MACCAALLLLGAAVWLGVRAREGKELDGPQKWVKDIRAEGPIHHQWILSRNRRQQYIPKSYFHKILSKEFNRWNARENGVRMLAVMGTNAWPVLPELIGTLNAEDLSIRMSAGFALAKIQAIEHPDWDRFASQLEGSRKAIEVFHHLIDGRNRAFQSYDADHSRFALAGLGAVGAIANQDDSRVIKVLVNTEDYELWPYAACALLKTGGDIGRPAFFYKDVWRDREEWPHIRAVAVQTLRKLTPNDPELRGLLREGLKDDMGLVRFAAAAELWRLSHRAEEALPTFKSLLGHKLVTVRTNVLGVITEMGPVAKSLETDVARLITDEKEAIRLAAAGALQAIAGNGGSDLKHLYLKSISIHHFQSEESAILISRFLEPGTTFRVVVLPPGQRTSMT